MERIIEFIRSHKNDWCFSDRPTEGELIALVNEAIHAEREACAKIADEECGAGPNTIAQAIRERGK